MVSFACIGLVRPKTTVNVGSVLRAAHCYGASMVAVEGGRYHGSPTDVTCAWRSLPLLKVESLRSVIPHDCVPVAIELVEGAKELPSYAHPLRAFYIFGPEDGTLGKSVLSWCRDVVMVPTAHCMNLAATVNVVLYDRMAKEAAR